MSINSMFETWFHGAGASPHCFPLTTTTKQVYIAGSSQRQLSTALRRQWIPSLARLLGPERFTGCWARLKAWCGRRKVMVWRSWREKKEWASRWFAHSQVSLWYTKGFASVRDNAPELNKVVIRRPPMYHEYPNLPDITLTALAETGRTELNILVLKQRSYTGNGAVIPSALANVPCADLGVEGVLKRLNAKLGTSYSLGSKVLGLWRKTTLRSILKPYVKRNDDFGTVYSHLRRFWYIDDVAEIEDALRTREGEDREMRKKVLVDGRITTRGVPPRRVWDLRANRVVPYWVLESVWEWRWRTHVWGISHAWVDENDRVNVMTPINGQEWPTPMPKDTNLDLIRIEMLNLGAQYAWLDVLCLRQEGGKGEHLRLEEWKLDVPTIGRVYSRPQPVVCYFNGLGGPLHLTRDYFESDRCWFRRAWTLQEITRDPIIGGETGNDVAEDEVRKRFDEQLAHLQQIRNRDSALELASEMRNRVSSKPLDKVAGLAYLVYSDCIPIYDAEMSDADAWEVLMDVMFPRSRSELFFYFPEPGNGRKYWRPSWKQIMTLDHRPPTSKSLLGYLDHKDTDGDWYEGYCIDSADVGGLDEGLEEEKPRKGVMLFKTSASFSCTFKISADHSYPIPDGSYALIDPVHRWVVGQIKEGGKFEKFLKLRVNISIREQKQPILCVMKVFLNEKRKVLDILDKKLAVLKAMVVMQQKLLLQSHSGFVSSILICQPDAQIFANDKFNQPSSFLREAIASKGKTYDYNIMMHFHHESRDPANSPIEGHGEFCVCVCVRMRGKKCVDAFDACAHRHGRYDYLCPTTMKLPNGERTLIFVLITSLKYIFLLKLLHIYIYEKSENKDRMFDTSEEAGVAGNRQWALDVGIHQDNLALTFVDIEKSGPDFDEDEREEEENVKKRTYRPVPKPRMISKKCKATLEPNSGENLLENGSAKTIGQPAKRAQKKKT
ncbi:hypothetical protein IW261DRAFT_1593739 [Armillaria novae-zelandiae]|uniref:Heterokaryon incompatibility domain-containing protein n=1 Tax=Armillaria novae-zelandiae TaxID=153914 RepID=A0AA39UED4_9AGAR|nr:hypothetical protein IW261DRAFT_1593739 [Armillaria novae-zelandiae]